MTNRRAGLLALLAAGCRGGTGGDAPDGGVTEDITALAPTLRLEGDEVTTPVVVPCGEIRAARLVNHMPDEQRVDVVTIDADPRLVLAEDLDLPRVVRPGKVLEIPFVVDASAPASLSATVHVESTAGVVDGTVTFDVAYAEERSETFVTALPQVDVLFAVDHSGSMAADYGEELTQGISLYLDALTAVSDWHFALLTTDDACATGGVFDGTDPDAAASYVADHAFDDGGGGSDHTEALLQLASDALAENASTECNADFHRDGAQLHVIAVSDEPEQSGRNWSFWVDDYEVYADEVRVSAVADLGDGCGGGGGAGGYEDAADATDGVLLDICDRNWGARLDDLAEAVDALPAVLVLAQPALPDSIVARIDGKKVPSTYDAASGAVTVPDAADVGTEVVVDYAVPGTCPTATTTR